MCTVTPARDRLALTAANSWSITLRGTPGGFLDKLYRGPKYFMGLGGDLLGPGCRSYGNLLRPGVGSFLLDSTDGARRKD